MLFLYIFSRSFYFHPYPSWLFKVAVNYIIIHKIPLWIQWMYLSISILMIDSQVRQVEGLFSLPDMPFFHDKLVMTMKLKFCNVEPRYILIPELCMCNERGAKNMNYYGKNPIYLTRCAVRFSGPSTERYRKAGITNKEKNNGRCGYR